MEALERRWDLMLRNLKSKTGVCRNPEMIGPTLALRTNIDALPIVEQTGLDYASKMKERCMRVDMIYI